MNAQTELMTSAAALSLYDGARSALDYETAAHALARILRHKAPAKVKASKGFDMTAAGLSRALKVACRVIEARNTIPILSTVLIEARGDVLRLTGTDLDIYATLDVAAPGVGEWRCAIDAKALGAALAKANGDVRFAVEERTKQRRAPATYQQGVGTVQGVMEDFVEATVTVTAGPSTFTFAGRDPGDFPKPAKLGEGPTFDIAGDTLADALQFVRLSISTEESRYYLNGAFVHVYQGELAFVATDGHRLARVATPLPEGAAEAPSVIVPRKTVETMLATLGADAVRCTVGKAGVRFEQGALTLVSKVIDGSFPDYHRVIPRDNAYSFEVEREAMAAAVARVASVSSEKSRAVRFAFGQGDVEMTCRNMDGSATTETLALLRPAERELDTGFNANYVTQALASYSGASCVLAMHDGASPALLTSPGCDDRLIVLMPLRV